MMKNPKPMSGISAGKFDLTFKTMFPLYNNGEYIVSPEKHTFGV